MAATRSIHEFLRETHVPYTLVHHPPAFTAREEAAAAQVPGRDWAKVVACFVDGEPIEAVVPARATVNEEGRLAFPVARLLVVDLVAVADGEVTRLERLDRRILRPVAHGSRRASKLRTYTHSSPVTAHGR
mgnify:CR=1 FL=1